MERSCSTGQSPQWAVVPVEEGGEEEEEDAESNNIVIEFRRMLESWLIRSIHCTIRTECSQYS
jgi:hypothetical protein